MNDRALRVLELDKVLGLLAQHCVSEMGQRLALALRPSVYTIEVNRWQQETQEALAYLGEAGSSPVHAFDDISDSLHKTRIDGILMPGELLRCRLMLCTSRLLKRALMETEPTGLLYGYASGLISAKDVEDEIERCIISEDEISDHASPELYRIRRDIKNCHARVRDKLNRMLHSPEVAKYLQDPIITLRNDRYVLPVKAEYRAMVSGLIHDQSGSGQTLFIEPMAVVEINNELKELLGKEREEIERILAMLSALVGRNQENMSFSLENMARLDFIFAKALLAADMKAVRPVLNQERRLHIRQGRHPLIDAQKVVPTELWMGQNFTTLVITGPNTGGKTVTLKTCGLFAAMHQSGLHVPADEGTGFPVFSAFYVDIGDEQSIEQSLSTFSGHMTQIVSILKQVKPDSLVLLDELGAGTDPTEGAALAISILEKLTAMGTLTLATTHYSELKAYALSAERVENASVEFDVARLRPTYRLSIGIPGKSNAFEISRRLGLEEGVIERAQDYLSKEQIRFEDVIQNAEYHRQLAEKEREQAEIARRESERLKRQVQSERVELETQREKILSKAKADAAQLLKKTRNEMDSVIADLKRQKNLTQADRDRAIQQSRDRLRAAQEEMAPETKAQEAAPGEPLKTVTLGQTVYVVNAGGNGTVTGLPNGKGECQVAIGVMKMNVKLADLRAAAQEEKPRNVKRESRPAVLTVPLELDIRGQDAESGVMEMERYLDLAFRGGRQEVSIIHGKGTGILRDACHKALRRNAQVESFRLGQYGEGETGVTIVKFKK